MRCREATFGRLGVRSDTVEPRVFAHICFRTNTASAPEFSYIVSSRVLTFERAYSLSVKKIPKYFK